METQFSYLEEGVTCIYLPISLMIFDHLLKMQYRLILYLQPYLPRTSTPITCILTEILPREYLADIEVCLDLRHICLEHGLQV